MTVPSAGLVLHPTVDADGVAHLDERALRLDDALDDALGELVLGALDVVVVERELDERVEVVALHVHETRRALFRVFHSGLHVPDRLCLEWHVCFHACSFLFAFCP